MAGLRLATPEDIPALAELESAFPGEDRFSASTWRRLLEGNNLVLVSNSGEGVAGAAVLLFRRGARIDRFYSITVSEAARGTGLSAQLLSRCEDLSREKGCTYMRLEVRETNSRAIRLYERHGYRVMARAADYYPDGETALRMEKPLTGRSSEEQ